MKGRAAVISIKGHYENSSVAKLLKLLDIEANSINFVLNVPQTTVIQAAPARKDL